MAEFKRLFPGFQRVAGTSRKDKEHTGDFRLALNHLKLQMAKLGQGAQASFQDWLGKELLILGEERRFPEFMARRETVLFLEGYQGRLEEAVREEERRNAEAEEAEQRKQAHVLAAFFAIHPATLAAFQLENPTLAASLLGCQVR